MPRTKHFGSGSKDQSSGSRARQQQKSRPTHFLCFPIASDDTVPKIAEALGYWRGATTKPVRQIPVRRRDGDAADGDGDGDGLGRGSGSFTTRSDIQERSAQQESNDRGNGDANLSNVQRPTTATLAERLKILPPIVTRQAGTYHLTLGVMNLDDEGQKEKALEILRGLDLKGLLKQAEEGPPVGYKPARKWEDKRSEGAGDDTRGTTNIRDETKIIEGNDLHRSKLSAQDSGSRQPEPLYISLTGLGGFPSLKNAGVLWARPKEQAGLSNGEDRPVFKTTDRLYNFALHLIQPFREAGIITETRPLALHATVANMRFAKQTSKANSWVKRTYGFRPDQVDAREIGKIWNAFDGKVEVAAEANFEAANTDDHEDDQLEEPDDETPEKNKEGVQSHTEEHHFVWIKDVEINRVAICKLGASKHEDPLWGEWYPAIENGERLVSET